MIGKNARVHRQFRGGSVANSREHKIQIQSDFEKL